MYLTIGALNIVGAMYIGINQGLMPGYAVLGLSCMIAGVLVKGIRRNARSAKQPPSPETSAHPEADVHLPQRKLS